MIPGTDALIIATAALRIGAAMFTHGKHFDPVDGLTVIRSEV